jgi:SNF2 family DNA or RNA helicase
VPVIVDTTHGTVAGTMTPGMLEAIETLPERAWRAGPVSRFVPSMANLRHLRAAVAGGIEWCDPAGRLAKLAAMDAYRREGHRKPAPFDLSYGFRTPPIGRQIEAFAFARYMEAFALFNDPGTGKSWCGLAIAAAKFEADEIDCLLIVAPNGVHRQWIDEQVPKHLPDILHRAVVYKKTKAARRAAMEPLDGGMRILSVNVEALSRGQAVKEIERFVRSGRCMVIVDEGTRIKNWTTKRTKSVIALGRLATVRAVLTGTPITKGLADLFPMFWFLDPDIIGLSTYRAFRDRYCVTVPAYRGAALGHVKVVGHKNVAELTSLIAPYCFRITKEGLPAKVYMTRSIELSDEQREHYNDLVRRFQTEIAGGMLTAVNAAARTIRLQQVLSGLLVLDEGEPVAIPEHRSASLIDLLEDLGEVQVVVWVRFHHDADVISAALARADISHVVCDGRTPDRERAARKQTFVSGNARVLVGNPAAMGTGTDGLQVAPVTVFYSHTYDAEQTWQAEDRTHREGMVETGGVYYRFVAPRTVDEQVLSNAASKLSLAERIVNDPSILQTV